MISREEAREILKDMHDYMHEGYITDLAYGGKQDEAMECNIEALSVAIEALSTERPKGRRENIWHGEFIATLECSVCGRRINVDYPLRERTISRKYPYCHCGADMRGEEE